MLSFAFRVDPLYNVYTKYANIRNVILLCLRFAASVLFASFPRISTSSPIRGTFFRCLFFAVVLLTEWEALQAPSSDGM